MKPITDIVLGPLAIKIHERSNADADDYWDGNWLVVTASVDFGNSHVSVSGPIIHLPELRRWSQEVGRLYRTLSGEAELKCMEPNLKVTMSMAKTGALSCKIEITPDPNVEQHVFVVALDQSFLPPMMNSLENAIEAYPIKGRPSDRAHR
jgi:hypothetical protein